MLLAKTQHAGLRPCRAPVVAWIGCVVCLLVTPLHALTVDVRLMCELTGGCEAGDFFYDHPQALDTLRFATKAFEPFTDNLLAISSSPTWTASFTNPDSGALGYLVADLSIPADTFVIYAGGYDMAGNQVGAAGPGTATAPLDRGQGMVTGATAIDFASWGGSIAFDTHGNGVPRNWHFGISTSPAPGELDFLTIAYHELAHAFGFGTAASFDNLNSSGQFQGAASVNLTGSTVALATDGDHWATGTTSPPYDVPPLSALTPSLVLGRRRLLTPLDYAALADLGWEVPTKLIGLHGDIDADGDVDGRDFLSWQRTVGNTGVGLLGDADGSLEVNDYDLWLWQTSFGSQIALAEPFFAVPEPTTFLTGWFGALMLLGSRSVSSRPLRSL